MEKYTDLYEEDKWILSLFEDIIKNITENLSKYHVYVVLRDVLNFVVNHLSREYIKLVRRRVWIEEEGWIKKSAYHTLFYILRKITLILAPFLPHISEYLYKDIIGKYTTESKDSVHLEKWPKFEERLIKKELVDKYDYLWNILALTDSIRHSAGIKKRQPLKEVYLPKEIYDRFTQRQIQIIKEQNNVIEVSYYSDDEIERFLRLKPVVKINLIGPIFKEKLPAVKEAIERLSSYDVSELLRKGDIEVYIESIGKINITSDMIDIQKVEKSPYKFGEIDGKQIFLNVEIDEKLLLSGLTRDLVRRIQVMRKDMKLNVIDNIDIYVYTDEDDVIRSIEEYRDYISSETRALKLLVNEDCERGGYEREWEIDSYKVKLKIVKIDG
jgi:isoleucyl-tRNA synthetase